MKQIERIVISESGLYQKYGALEKSSRRAGGRRICEALLEDDRIRTFRVRMPVQAKHHKPESVIRNIASGRHGFDAEDEIIEFRLVVKSKFHEYYMVQIIPFSYIEEIELRLVEKNMKIRNMDTLIGRYVKEISGHYMLVFISENQTHMIFNGGDYFEVSKISLGHQDIVDERVGKYMKGVVEKAVEVKKLAFGRFDLYAPAGGGISFLNEIGFEEIDLKNG